LTNKKLNNWQFLSEITYDGIEPGLVLFFLELLALALGTKSVKVEKLISLTAPSILLYSKTGTITYPKYY
jgi:hypothetical protein